MESSMTTAGDGSGGDRPRQALSIESESKGKNAAAAATVATESSANAKPVMADASRASNPLKARKRTKTGCLTCRKRRIKCGEERPTCSNCVKSKRNCEGYTPRVIFKDPLNAFRPAVGTSQGAPAQFHPLSGRDPAAAQYTQMQSISAHPIPLPVIAPRPSPQEDQMESSSMATIAGHGVPRDIYHPYTSHPYDSQPYPPHGFPPSSQHPYPPRESAAVDLGQLVYHPEPNSHMKYESQVMGERASGMEMSRPGLSSDWPPISVSSNEASLAYVDSERYDGPTPPVGALYGPSPIGSSTQMMGSHQAHVNPYSDGWRKPKSGDIQDLWSAFNPPQFIQGQDPPKEEVLNAINGGVSVPIHDDSDLNMQKYAIQNMYPFPMHSYSTVEDREDDYWDVDSDEENGTTPGRMAAASSSELGLMLALAANQNDRGIRSLHSFLNEPNVLSTYHPAYTASPLMDPQTARVFCHFITATAPTLSLCERHPANPSIIFSGSPVPESQRSLWTYTLPMLALSHQGLLHSMLALASLHIAKFQQTSPTPSLKHYHYALRRVAKALTQPAKRQDVATLAATLLLGFYEVTTAEHNKWNSHLAGARQLVMDIDFVGMGKRLKATKARMQMNRKAQHYYDSSAYGYSYNGGGPPEAHQIPEDGDAIDENLVSTIMGWKTSYDHYGRVLEPSDTEDEDYKPMTPKEMENFELQCDLFWWYGKQDMYQSMVSGNRLLLSYDWWSHCPPRAPIGKLDAVYGSMDHLILLTARVADFAGKDRKRKIRAAAANSTQPNPQPGVSSDPSSPPQSNHQMSPPSGQNGPRPNMSGQFPAPSPMQQQQQQPPMYGMMPSAGPIRLPSGFKQEPGTWQRNSPPADDQELEAATRKAEHEWNDIYHALDVFEESLGPDYQPLSPDHMQPLSTPFGPALYYRAYSISCVWALYYTARIMAMRANPSMPPAAMVAAGAAAPRTAAWANTIGRICAGIQPLTNTTPLNPTHGAALMDSSMGLFHAGVQYRDAAQRGWTITKLRDIARLTGWQTSALIASGCERSWMRAAEMRMGPPYQRTMNVAAKDDRVAGRARDPVSKFYPPKDNNDRRFITVNPGTRVYWALGILSAEEDMKSMSLKD